jgi:hypothetical protein
MNWSRETLKDMPETEYRVLSQMRFDEICDHCKECKNSYVTKGFFWKMTAGWAIALAGIIWKFFTKSG